MCLLLLWMWRNWLLAAGCGCSGLFSGLLRVSAQLPGHVEHCFPAMPGAGSRFVGTLDTNLLLFVNIKTFQLDEYKINVDKTAVWHSGGCIKTTKPRKYLKAQCH